MGQAESHFSFYKLSSDTFFFTQEHAWNVMPTVYAKVYDDVVVVIDTGSFGSTVNEEKTDFQPLRSLLEIQPVLDNNGLPLNEGGNKKYVVLSTHCHLDHIVRQDFQSADPERAVDVWASSYDKDFVHMKGVPHPVSCCRLSQAPDRPEDNTSQEDALVIPVRTPEEQFVDREDQLHLGKDRSSSRLDNPWEKSPDYTITYWADDGEDVTTTIKDSQQVLNLGLTVFHAPGRLQDQIVVWDPTQRILFSGDLAYEILYMNFEQGASFQIYCDTLAKIQTLVQGWNAETPSDQKRVTLAGAHGRFEADAEELLSALEAFLLDVMEGRIEGEDRGSECGGESVAYELGTRFSICGRRELFEDFRADDEAMEKLRKRKPHERAGSLARSLDVGIGDRGKENAPIDRDGGK